MKRNKFYLVVILLVLAAYSQSVFAQVLYVPGGSVSTSTNGNVGIRVSNPNYQFEVFGNTYSDSPEIALVHRYWSSKTGMLVEYDWKISNESGTLKLYNGSSNNGMYPSTLSNFYQFSSGAFLLNNAMLNINKSTGTLLKLDNVLVTRESYGLRWLMSGQEFEIKTGNLSLTSSAYIDIDATGITAGFPAILISDDGGLVKAFKTDVNSVETLSILTNGDITTSGAINADGNITTYGNLNTHGNLWTMGDISTHIINSEKLIIRNDGEINFAVNENGYVWAREINVTLGDIWPDYVFGENYKLMSLEELDAFIAKNGHLPNMPTAEEVKEEGIELAEMNVLLVEKVEELTLYILELQKEIDELKQKANN